MLPSPLLAVFGRTLAGRAGMLSPLPPPGPSPGGQPTSAAGSTLQRTAALKGSAAAAATESQGAMTPGHAVSAMIPLVEPADLAPGPAPAVHRRQGTDHLPILPLQGGMFIQVQPQARRQEAALRLAMVGESEGLSVSLGGPPPAGSRPACAGIPDIVFKLPEQAGAGCQPVSSAGSRGRAVSAAGGSAIREAAGSAGDAMGTWADANRIGPGPANEGLAAQVAHKIREVRDKVRQVEERWGPLSLKTAQAHFLLHRACRHPQAAADFQAAGMQALQR